MIGRRPLSFGILPLGAIAQGCVATAERADPVVRSHPPNGRHTPRSCRTRVQQTTEIVEFKP